MNDKISICVNNYVVMRTSLKVVSHTFYMIATLRKVYFTRRKFVKSTVREH